MTQPLCPLQSTLAQLRLTEAIASTRDNQHAIARDLMTQAIVSACRALGMGERECSIVEMACIRSELNCSDYEAAHRDGRIVEERP